MVKYRRMLVDNIIITIKAGNGGNGSVSFLRNAKTAKGGPDGGDGGNGGNVYFKGVNDISALNQFRFKKSLKAEDGIRGDKKNLHGRNGEDIIVKVPIGTLINDIENNTAYEILDEENELILARGGKGGRGNREFRTSTDQAPQYRELGEEGETKKLELNLRLIADVGLIGLPNAGKSSLLSVLTNANPKIGDYPFTTLEPNLGAMEQIILADIPGLIEGASHGKGLGIKFLKHIEKTKVLIHCIDSTSEDLLETYKTVRNELEVYSKILLEKEELILLTKSDLAEEKKLKKQLEIFKKEKKEVMIISIYDIEKLEELKELILNRIKSNFRYEI